MEEESESIVRNGWSEADTEYLRKNYRNLTATQIGVHLQKSRNAVIGKAMRMGLATPRSKPPPKYKPRQTYLSMPARTIPEPPRRIPEPSRRIPVAKSLSPVEPKHVSLLELEADQCKWPFGQGPYTFCGCNTHNGERYCPYHNWLSSRRS